RTFTITPAPNASGTATLTITVHDGALSASRNFLVTVNPINDPPSLSVILDQLTDEDVSIGPVAVTVSDPDTNPASLTLSASSSNPALIPDANVTFGGSGANRTFTITPAPNASGTATLTITVHDGALSASRNFLVTVNPINDPPSLSVILDQLTDEDVSIGPVAVTVSDPDTNPASLTLSASSS